MQEILWVGLAVPAHTILLVLKVNFRLTLVVQALPMQSDQHEGCCMGTACAIGIAKPSVPVPSPNQ